MHASFYLAILTIIYYYMSFEVIKRRRLEKASIGLGNKGPLSRYASAASNFAHYAPLFIICLIMAEQAWAMPAWLVHVSGIAFVMGRLLHFKSLTEFELREKPIFKFRVAGMILTFIPLLGLSVYILAMYAITLAKAT